MALDSNTPNPPIFGLSEKRLRDLDLLQYHPSSEEWRCLSAYRAQEGMQNVDLNTYCDLKTAMAGYSAPPPAETLNGMLAAHQQLWKEKGLRPATRAEVIRARTDPNATPICVATDETGSAVGYWAIDRKPAEGWNGNIALEPRNNTPRPQIESRDLIYPAAWCVLIYAAGQLWRAIEAIGLLPILKTIFQVDGRWF